jgi:hypothetical protein
MTKTSTRRRLEAFFHSKTGKILPVLLIALLIGAASSTVYSYYIANGTATVKTPDLILRAGSDSPCGTTFPCATVTVGTTPDFETISLSLFPSATNTPQPATYYSNLTTIQNHGTASHSIKSIQVFNFGGTPGLSALGKIVVYYCTAFTEFNPDGTPVTSANCVASYTITSSSTGYNSLTGSPGLPQTLTAGSKGYIEVYAYAASGAGSGNTITFSISFQWL